MLGARTSQQHCNALIPLYTTETPVFILSVGVEPILVETMVFCDALPIVRRFSSHLALTECQPCVIAFFASTVAR